MASSTAISSSFAVDVRNGSSANGAEVRLWGTNGTAAQKWRISHDSQGYVTFANVGSGKVLDVANGWLSVGVDVRQWASNGSWAQKWIAVRNSDGTYTFLSALARGRGLDVAGGHAAWGGQRLVVRDQWHPRPEVAPELNSPVIAEP